MVGHAWRRARSIDYTNQLYVHVITHSPSHAAAEELVRYFPEQDGVLAESLLFKVCVCVFGPLTQPSTAPMPTASRGGAKNTPRPLPDDRRPFGALCIETGTRRADPGERRGAGPWARTPVPELCGALSTP